MSKNDSPSPPTGATLINSIAAAALRGDMSACRVLLAGSGVETTAKLSQLSDAAVRFVVMGVIVGAQIADRGAPS